MSLASIDREIVRIRPLDEAPTQFQIWQKLLFIHWPVEPDIIRSRLPAGLEVDLHDGCAWIGLVPFTMHGIRHRLLPPIPGVRAFHELNVRTYVHRNGVPGVWFFSLDAANALAVLGARRLYSLPYFRAQMSLTQRGQTISYSSHRTHRGAPAATFDAAWEIHESLPPSALGSLEFFLTERYGLYTHHRGRLQFCRIWHNPWPLRRATLRSIESSMIEAAGLPTPTGEPLLHYSESLPVQIHSLRPCAPLS